MYITYMTSMLLIKGGFREGGGPGEGLEQPGDSALASMSGWGAPAAPYLLVGLQASIAP